MYIKTAPTTQRAAALIRCNATTTIAAKLLIPQLTHDTVQFGVAGFGVGLVAVAW